MGAARGVRHDGRRFIMNLWSLLLYLVLGLDVPEDPETEAGLEVEPAG